MPSPPVFFLPKNFVWYTELKQGTNKYEYFQNNCLCGVKTENNENPLFYGLQNRGVSESPVYKEQRHCKMLLAKLRLYGNIRLLRRPERKG